MDTRKLVALGVAATALLAVAAAASRGRPLAGSTGGDGPSAGFFDYVFTSLVLVAALASVVAVFSLVQVRGGPVPARGPHRLLLSMAVLLASVAFAVLLARSDFGQRLRQLIDQARPPASGQTQQPARPAPRATRGTHIRWEEVAVVAALLAGAGVLVLAGRHRRRAPSELRRRSSHDALALALDESLEDLRNEPDLRRAIVAAYARMEVALARAGLPRRPAEAPLEYVERALLALEASAGSARRLTDLFERAKFSQHEPRPAMRDEAIAALVAVRDELRSAAEGRAA